MSVDANPFAGIVADGFAPRGVLGEFRLVQEHMVEGLAISRDGRWAVTDTGGRNSEVLYVWNLASGELAWRMENAHRNCFLFHPDGEHVLVYDRSSGGLRKRSLATGGDAGVVKLPKIESVSQLRAAADGSRVLVGHGDVIETATGEHIAHLEGFEHSYYPSYLSPRGNIVVSSRDDNSLWCHDLRTKTSTKLETLEDRPYAFAITTDEDLLVTRGFAHARVYRLADGTQYELDSNDGGDPIFPNAMAMSPDNKRVALSCEGRHVEVVALPDFTFEATLEIDRVHALAFLDDDHLLVARFGDIINYYDSAILETWRISSGERIDQHRGHRAGVLALAAAGDVLYSTGIDGSVRMWSLPDGTEAEMFPFDGERPDHVDVDDGLTRVFVAASSDYGGLGVVYDAKTFTAIDEIERSNAAAMSPDGTRIAIVTYNKPLQIVDVGGGEVLAEAERAEDSEYALAWSPDGKRVLARSQNGFRICDTACAQLFEHAGSDMIYDAVLLSNDGVVWVDESGLHLTRTSGSITREGTYYTYFSHHAVIAASHDGRSLAVTDGTTVWCFDAATLEDRGKITLGAQRYRILSLTYSGDDRQLFAGTSLGPIISFDVTPSPRAILG